MSNNKIALVTGANRGLGFETALQLGHAGATVLVGARDPERGAHAAEQLRMAGAEAEFVSLDVTDPATAQTAAQEVERRYGRLDVLINNAGILPEATQPGEQPIDLASFRHTFETNLFGAVAVTQALLPLLRRAPAARIVNVSSTMGSLQDQLDPQSPYFGLVVPAYQASKAALNSLTIALSKRLGDSAITVNAVCPGWVQTDLGGAENRAAAPTNAAEAASVVVEMALGSAGESTGQFLDREGVVAW
jgi:NAD(P)-dependent dehydrogenase (short-subunit alcohol dehydrogenase family)